MKNILRVFLLTFLFSAIVSCKYARKNNEIDRDKQRDKLINVGVFNGNGASPVCILETMEALKIDTGIYPVEVSAYDIMNGKLDELDALVFPGGSGSKEFNNMGQLAAEKIKEFGQKEGKGLVGICAGGYLLSTTPTYPSLEILGAPDTREYYDRGRGLISFHLNDKGKIIFYELQNTDSLFIQYYDGPIFANPEKYGLNVLGSIYSDIATHKGYPHGFTQGKPAFFTKKYGKGKVFVSVGHPEATAGMRWIVPRMARWTTGNKLISYSKDLIRPQINNKEVLFYRDTKKKESSLFWQLFDKDPSVVINAIDSLHTLRSRPSIRWSIGLLRHKNPKIRLKAADYIVESEYTAAIPDLQAAVDVEKVPEIKQKMDKKLGKLKGFVGK